MNIICPFWIYDKFLAGRWRGDDLIVKKKAAVTVILLILALFLSSCGYTAVRGKNVTIINVSYDPTREFFESYNDLFRKYWKEKTGQTVNIIQSHGGSGKQALEVANGLEADVVTLALESDINAIEDAGLIKSRWMKRLPDDSAPYTSTIVFLVRKGNPKHIKDWDDLVRDDVRVVTPSPKTSGGARWNFLAAWSYASEKYGGDENKCREFVRHLYENVVVLDSGARAATTSFTANGQGDVLIAWENEAFLSMKDSDGEYEIVTPSISILAQPSVAVVDENVKDHGTKEVSEAYLEYLYSDKAQEIAAEYDYRPVNQAILQKHSDVFDLTMKLTEISDFGGWEKAQEKFFSDGGIFDSIYEH